MFSVVVPLHNKERYIQRALLSVCQQTFAPAEIIVINDGSSDGGAQLAKSLAVPRLRVVDQPNRGASAARNLGVTLASQRWVAFLDADDRWRPGHLAEIKQLIEAFPNNVLFGGGFVSIESGHTVRTFVATNLGQKGQPVDLFKVWLARHVLHTSTTVAERAALVAVGGFPEGEEHLQDFVVWTKLALHGGVVLSPKVHAEYDIAVPGQSVEYWEGEYKKRFDILEFHRLLATEMRRLVLGGQATGSFVRFASYHLRLGLFQRLLAENLYAAERFDRELALATLPLGLAVFIARTMLRAWVGRLGLRLAARSIRKMRKVSKWSRA